MEDVLKIIDGFLEDQVAWRSRIHVTKSIMSFDDDDDVCERI